MASRYLPHAATTKLPSLGPAEGIVQEFKSKWIDKAAFHVARSIASLANTLGGTAFVGGIEKSGVITGYRALNQDELAKTERHIDESVRDLCMPRPVFSFARCPHEQGHVLAVNVEPHLSALVSVKALSDKDRCGYGGECWTFSIRSGSQTVFIDPEKLVMYMQPRLRRTILLLSAIPKDAEIRVSHTNRHDGINEDKGVFVGLDETKNSLICARRAGDNPFFFGLDLVRTVYHNGNSWEIILEPHR